MRSVIKLLCGILIFSCNARDINKNTFPLNQWILDNQEKIDIASDSVLIAYHDRNKSDTNWKLISIIVTKYSPGIIGRLALEAGDSTDCIVVEMTFYHDKNQKKKINIAAVDSSCLWKLKRLKLATDTTNSFIFGKNEEALY